MAMKKMEHLVQKFADGVAGRMVAMRAGNATSGNRHAKRADDAFRALCSFGDAGRDALVPLLNDERDEVRATAAAYLLRHKHEMARAVLQEISRGRGVMAVSARESLKRWSEGAWQLDIDSENAQIAVSVPESANESVLGARHAPQVSVGNVERRQGEVMRIGDISVNEVIAGKNWRVKDQAARIGERLVDVEIEECATFAGEDSAVYSGLSVSAGGEVRPFVLLREVGTHEWWGDVCEYVDGVWRDLDGPSDYVAFESFVASPASNDPSFSGEYSHKHQRAGFALLRERFAK